MDGYSASSGSQEDWLPEAQLERIPKQEELPLPNDSDSTSSSSSSSSSSSTSLNEDEKGSILQSVRRDSGSIESSNLHNKYIGFCRKPVEESEYPALGRKRQDRTYSDSDNEYENEVFIRSKDRGGSGVLDMDLYRDGEWGRRSLVDTMDGDLIESLVAWAHEGSNSRIMSISTDSEPSVENPLSQLPNVPLPLSFLKHLMVQATKIPEYEGILAETFDTSALVAIGMMIEDIVTASLLPLAGCHVLRCRELESKLSPDEALLAPPTEVTLTHPVSTQPIKFDPRNLPDDESSFKAWTMPPEEAIMQIARHGMLPEAGIPLLRDPTTTHVSGKPSARNGSTGRRTNKDVVQQFFSVKTKLNEEFLSSNQELVDVFLTKNKIVTRNRKRPRANKAFTKRNTLEEKTEGPPDGRTEDGSNEQATKMSKVIAI